MINRVTNTSVGQSTLVNLQRNLQAMASLQARLSSGKTVTKPSDDPAAAADILRINQNSAASEQYARNADNGNSWLTTIDTALQGAVVDLRRARDLTVQGQNAAMSTTAKEALATEIEGIRDGLMERANAQYMNRSVFAGTSNAASAFDPTTFAWNGVPGSSVQRRLSDATTVQVDTDGSKVFGQGASSVFALMDKIASDLRSGAAPPPHQSALDTSIDNMLTELASVGARENQVQDAQTQIAADTQNQKTQLSGVQDIDLAATILDLQQQQTTYQAALGAAAKVLEPSLLNFVH